MLSFLLILLTSLLVYFKTFVSDSIAIFVLKRDVKLQLTYFPTHLPTHFTADPFRFQVVGRRRRPNLALVFLAFIICCNIFCYGCMFAFVVSLSVFQYYAKRLAGKNVFEMTCFVSGGT